MDNEKSSLWAYLRSSVSIITDEKMSSDEKVVVLAHLASICNETILANGENLKPEVSCNIQ